MKQLLLLCLALGLASVSFGQQLIRGQVTDDAGEPVIGATVVIDGTSTGTVTDIDGNFEINVPEGDVSFQVSYLGYEPQVIPLGDQDFIAVRLSEGVALSEVVVTGYSQGTKREATGAIATIDAAKLQAIPSANIEQQLQGRASGVTVITNGQPGTQSKVRIRGFGSFNSNQPLYVVDGVPTTDVSFLPPDDIETTTILKDAASASIYGARAASGVIVYTTKRGTRNPGVQVSYDMLLGTTYPGEGQPILNPQQQADFTLRAFQNASRSLGQNPDTILYSHPQYGQNTQNFTVPDFLLVGDRRGVSAADVDLNAERELYNDDFGAGPIYLVVRANQAGTDWYDEATDNAFLQRHNLGFSGGGEQGRFYFGLSAQDQEGILLEQRFRRYAFRANSEFDVAPGVRFGENLQVTYSSTLGLIGGGGGQNVANSESDVLTAFRLAPAIPVFTEFDDPDAENRGYAGTVVGGFNNPRNVVAQRRARRDDINRNFGLFGNIYAEVDIVPGLYVRSLLGGGYSTYTGRAFGRRTYEDSENTASVTYNEFSGNQYNWVNTNTINFDFDLGDRHNIKGLAGYELVNLPTGANNSASGINPFSRDPNFVNISQVANPNPRSDFFNGARYASILSQVNYNYADKYYVTGVLRRDKYSALLADNQSGVFPAISAAWRVTGEDFARPTDVLSDLKIRGGYGIMGNAAAVPQGNTTNLYGGSLGASAYPISGSATSATQGFIQTRIGNPDARWELSETTNVGVEATLFGSKFDVIVDLWQKRNTDVLIRAQLPDALGAAERPFVNVGTINNRGIDVQLTYRDRRGDFNWEVDLTGSFLNNEIEVLADNIDFFDAGGTRIGQPVRNLAGQPMSTFFGYQVTGLWQTQAEIDAANAGAPLNADGTPGTYQDGIGLGRFRYEDVNSFGDDGELTGVPDGRIDPADRQVIGSPIPDFTGGLNLRVGYKGFDLETFLYTSLGNEIFNFSKWFTDFYPSFPGAAVSERVTESWTPGSGINDQPIFENVSNFSTNNTINSFYVEDGSYLRMRHITLGYTLPDQAFDGVFSRARVYVSANNIFTITGYKGLDPQVGGEADTNFGIDIGNYPVTRAFNFGIGLGF